jgi:hypothetical protein
MNYRYYIPTKLFKEGTSLCFNPTIYAEFTASSTATTGDSYDSYFYVENAYGGLTVTKENGEYKVYDYAKDSSKLTESKYAKVIIRGNYVAVYVKKAPMKTTSSDYYEADTGTADEDGEVVNSPKPISEILGSKKANCRLNISVYGLNTKATGSIYFDVVRIKSAGNEIYTNFNQDKETYSFESGTTVSGSDLTPSRWNLNDLQTLTTKFTTKTYTASQLRRSSVTTKIGAKACTPISYQVTSGSKYVSVTSGGKVTLKKGTPKGTYKIKVTARARFNFPKKTTTVTIKVK